MIHTRTSYARTLNHLHVPDALRVNQNFGDWERLKRYTDRDDGVIDFESNEDTKMMLDSGSG